MASPKTTSNFSASSILIMFRAMQFPTIFRIRACSSRVTSSSSLGRLAPRLVPVDAPALGAARRGLRLARVPLVRAPLARQRGEREFHAAYRISILIHSSSPVSPHRREPTAMESCRGLRAPAVDRLRHASPSPCLAQPCPALPSLASPRRALPGRALPRRAWPCLALPRRAAPTSLRISSRCTGRTSAGSRPRRSAAPRRSRGSGASTEERTRAASRAA